MPSPLTSVLTLKDIPGKMLSLTKAILLGTRISEARVRKRVEICFECEYVEAVPVSREVAKTEEERVKMRCGICGCKMGYGNNELINLAAYEETKDYGCKYPGGSRWKREGV